jgi:hypothetical protein
MEEYVMMPEGSPVAIDNDDNFHRIRLRATARGVEYPLPESLIELWRRGQVTVDRIPALALAIGPSLLELDSNLILGQSTQKTVVKPILMTFGLVFGAGLFATLMEGAPVWIGLGVAAFLTAVISAILMSLRQSALSRRAEQMRWLLAAEGRVEPVAVADAMGRPAGKTIGVGMMVVWFYVWMTVFAIVVGAALALWYFVLGGKAPSF